MLNSFVNILAEYSFIFIQDIQQFYFIINFTSVFLRNNALSCASSNAGRKRFLFNLDVDIKQNPVSGPRKIIAIPSLPPFFLSHEPLVINSDANQPKQAYIQTTVEIKKPI